MFERKIFYFVFLCLLAFTDCQPEVVEPAEQMPNASYSPNHYPDLLNYRGHPKQATDRSVYAFFDQGAWFGYGLPDVDSLPYPGSFTGPYLLTQDNGVWIAQSLAKLEILVGKKQEVVNWQTAKQISSHAFPGRLEQIFELPDLGLRIQTSLIFASSRTSVSRIQVQRIQPGENHLSIRWSGDSFLAGVNFSEHSNSVQINFDKNDHLGIISTDSPKALYRVTDKKYQLSLPIDNLAEGKPWVGYLYQHFYFSQKEQKAEEIILERLKQNPEKLFNENQYNWSRVIQKILDRPSPLLRDSAHQKVALKCLQTLTNNWRSPAGFLLHQGLFPSYNYEWFNGFWSWDSWKHAVALVVFNEALAKDQIRAMYDFQDSTGMIADCVYRDTIIENHNWRDTKPPLSAWAIWTVFKKTNDLAFLQELFPKLEKYHQWWYRYRDHDQNGLCEYGSTDGSLIAAKWESGMDNALRFDHAEIRKNKSGGWSLNQESVDLNAYLFAEKKYLAKICKLLYTLSAEY